MHNFRRGEKRIVSPTLQEPILQIFCRGYFCRYFMFQTHVNSSPANSNFFFVFHYINISLLLSVWTFYFINKKLTHGFLNYQQTMRDGRTHAGKHTGKMSIQWNNCQVAMVNCISSPPYITVLDHFLSSWDTQEIICRSQSILTPFSIKGTFVWLIWHISRYTSSTWRPTTSESYFIKICLNCIVLPNPVKSQTREKSFPSQR